MSDAFRSSPKLYQLREAITRFCLTCVGTRQGLDGLDRVERCDLVECDLYDVRPRLALVQTETQKQVTMDGRRKQVLKTHRRHNYEARHPWSVEDDRRLLEWRKSIPPRNFPDIAVMLRRPEPEVKRRYRLLLETMNPPDPLQQPNVVVFEP